MLTTHCKKAERYTARVREYAAEIPLDLAVERAVDECIKERILEDFLRKNRAEAIKMSIYEYDEELHMRQSSTASSKLTRLNTQNEFVICKAEEGVDTAMPHFSALFAKQSSCIYSRNLLFDVLEGRIYKSKIVKVSVYQHTSMARRNICC